MAAPNPTAIQPASGLPSGGDPVTITGTGFQQNSQVAIGGAPATAVQLVSNTELTCIAPAHTPGTVDVVVTNPSGQSGTLPNGYSYDPPPQVQSVNPASGPIAGGQNVSIQGGGFKSGAGVNFDGAPATNVQVTPPNTITCDTPPNVPFPVDVTVDNPDGQVGTLGAGYIYNGPPIVISVEPSSGPTTGSPATLEGEGFQTGATVELIDPANVATSAQNVNVISGNLITCNFPAGLASGPYDVRVTNPDSQSGLFGAAYVCSDPPTVTGVSPNNGSAGGGAQVAVTGSNFQNGAVVTFDGAPASNVTFVDAANLLCVTPVHFASQVSVSVTNPNQQSGTLANAYTFNGPPSIQNVNPANGPSTGGTLVTVSGAGFQAGLSATFGGAPASNITPGGAPATSFTCNTPAHAPGPVDVLVVNPDGQAGTFLAGFIFDYPAPTIATVGPNEGTRQGGTLVTITGTGFEPGALVTFNGVPAIVVAVVNSTQIIVETPPHDQGIVDVTVENADGQSVTAANSYTYTNP